jgi:signal transduction histidine kinase
VDAGRLTAGPRGSTLSEMSEPADLSQRLSFLGLSRGDLELLADLRPVLQKHADGFVAAFYRHLLSFEPTRRLLRDPVVKERLLAKQREYLLSLAGPTVDDDFIAERRRIGEAHERIGLEPHWYLGAYALYTSLLTPLIGEAYSGDPERGSRVLVALQKLLILDAQIAVEGYIARHDKELRYLTRELAREGQRLGRDYEIQGAELRRTTQRAKAAEELASIATLVAGLAHEIGTPMGVIQGHAKMLESAISDDHALWRLTTIQEQIGRISKILQALLNMARPGRTPRMPIAVEPLLDTTLMFLSEKLARRRIGVKRKYGSVPSVVGDRERLQQLFLNLFLNATDAMPDGGELRVYVAQSEDGEVEIRVVDTGNGVPEADLPRLFEPFFTTKEMGAGNGLGLMVAKGIVTDHGGHIEVKSVVGEGTEFRLLFPVPSLGEGAGI